MGGFFALRIISPMTLSALFQKKRNPDTESHSSTSNNAVDTAHGLTSSHESQFSGLSEKNLHDDGVTVNSVDALFFACRGRTGAVNHYAFVLSWQYMEMLCLIMEILGNIKRK